MQDRSTIFPFDSLPFDIQKEILSFLDPFQLLNASFVSKKFNNFCNQKLVFFKSLQKNAWMSYKGKSIKEFYSALIKQKNEIIGFLDGETRGSFGPGVGEEEFDAAIKEPGYLALNRSSQYMTCMPYLIDEASNFGYKELLIYLIMKQHMIPSANPLVSAICSTWVRNPEEIQNNIDVVKMLIDAGADVTQCKLYLSLRSYHQKKITLKDAVPGLCPLAYAIKNDKPEVAKLLLQAGASLNNLCYYNPYNTTNDDYDPLARRSAYPAKDQEGFRYCFERASSYPWEYNVPYYSAGVKNEKAGPMTVSKLIEDKKLVPSVEMQRVLDDFSPKSSLHMVMRLRPGV